MVPIIPSTLQMEKLKNSEVSLLSVMVNKGKVLILMTYILSDHKDKRHRDQKNHIKYLEKLSVRKKKAE